MGNTSGKVISIFLIFASLRLDALPADIAEERTRAHEYCNNALIALRQSVIAGHVRVHADMPLDVNVQNPLSSLYNLLTPYQPLLDTQIIFVAMARVLAVDGFNSEAEIGHAIRALSGMPSEAQVEFASRVFNFLKGQLPKKGSYSELNQVVAFMKQNNISPNDQNEQVRMQAFLRIWSEGLKDGTAESAIPSLVLGLLHGQEVPSFDAAGNVPQIKWYGLKRLSSSEKEPHRVKALIDSLWKHHPAESKYKLIKAPIPKESREDYWFKQSSVFDEAALKNFFESKQFFEIDEFIRRNFYLFTYKEWELAFQSRVVPEDLVSAATQRAEQLKNLKKSNEELERSSKTIRQLQAQEKNLQKQVEGLRRAMSNPEAMASVGKKMRDSALIPDEEFMKFIEGTMKKFIDEMSNVRPSVRYVPERFISLKQEIESKLGALLSRLTPFSLMRLIDYITDCKIPDKTIGKYINFYGGVIEYSGKPLSETLNEVKSVWEAMIHALHQLAQSVPLTEGERLVIENKFKVMTSGRFSKYNRYIITENVQVKKSIDIYNDTDIYSRYFPSYQPPIQGYSMLVMPSKDIISDPISGRNFQILDLNQEVESILASLGTWGTDSIFTDETLTAKEIDALATIKSDEMKKIESDRLKEEEAFRKLNEDLAKIQNLLESTQAAPSELRAIAPITESSPMELKPRSMGAPRAATSQ